MNEAEKQKIIGELKDFYKELKSYKRLLDPKRELSESQKKYRESLREGLVRKTGKLKGVIIQLTGKQFYTQFGITRECWAEGLSLGGYLPAILTALGFCIDATNEAIGKLERDTETAGIQWTKKDVIRKVHEALVEADKQKPEDTVKLPIQLFDAMQFHPKVVEASRGLFKDGHYRDAIYRAFVEVNNFVKDKANSQLDGKKLMSTVFSLEKPIIKLNSLQTQSDRDEQEGFMFLFMGAMEGIRNPKAHENIIQNDLYKALEYLSFASLLMQTIDFWEAEET